MTGRALYLVNGSISSIRMLIALHEKGLAFEPRRLRVMREPRDTRTPAFLALNPRGQAPVLVEPDGVVMNESLAILTFLELRYPTPPLRPRDRPAERFHGSRTMPSVAITATCRPTYREVDGRSVWIRIRVASSRGSSDRRTAELAVPICDRRQDSHGYRRFRLTLRRPLAHPSP